MGWFPYLFYSTTYVAEVMANELGHEPDIDKATRAGSFALLIYSTGELSRPRLFADLPVAIVAGTLLPYLNARDRRLLKPPVEDEDADDEDLEIDRVRELVRQWRAEAARQGRPLKLPTSMSGESGMSSDAVSVPFMLRNIWTAGLLLFAAIMGSTFFITKVWQVGSDWMNDV